MIPPATASKLQFPFQQFPTVHQAIAYGSLFLPSSRSQRMVPSLPDFLLVIDEEKISVADWHAQNQKMNPTHYGCNKVMSPARCAQLHKKSPSVFIAPLSILEFPSADYGAIQRMSKYLVVTKADLAEDLTSWSEFYTAGRLQKPALIIDASHPDQSFTGDGARLTSNCEGELARNLEVNLLNASRLSLLMSDHHLTFRDLLRTNSVLSYMGDCRHRIGDEGLRARATVSTNLLSFVHLYGPLIPKLRKKWTLRLEEGDEEILSGRYTPREFRGYTDNTALQFDLSFHDPQDEELIQDIIAKTKSTLETYCKESYAARLLGLPSGPKAPAALAEAQAILNKKELVMKQAFSSEAHCSLFHALPDNFQAHAIGASAKARLGRIFNPFNLLDSERDRDILGGPLPWERRCAEVALRNVVRKTSRRAVAKGLVMAGPARASLWAMQQFCGRIVV